MYLWSTIPQAHGAGPHGEALLCAIIEHDQEGIIAKRLDAAYRAGRQPTWLKIKNRHYSRREALQWHG